MQFGYVSQLYQNGGLCEIGPAGQGKGQADRSLTNKKAARRQKWTGNNIDYSRQQAAAQYNRWIQEYAKDKQNETEKPSSTSSEFILKNDVYNRAGGQDYFNSVRHNVRRQFIVGSTIDWSVKINKCGDWKHITHTLAGKHMYNRFSD